MSPRKLLLWTWALVGIHLLWLGVRYGLGFPLWGDEAFVVNDFSGATYADLFAPLPNGQIAPLLWLCLEKFCFDWGDGSVYWLRLPALLSGIASTWLMLRFCLRALPQPSALFAFAVFAASYYPLRHAVEIKPYASDLLFTLIQFNLVLDLIAGESTRQRTKGIALVLVSLLGVWASYPSLFVSAAIAVFLLQRSSGLQRRAVFFGSVLVAGMAFWMVWRFALPHARAASWLQEMDMWKTAFPPLQHGWNLPRWLLERHCGYLSAYPTGGRNYASSLSFFLIVAGSVALWRHHQRSFLWLLWGPLLFNFFAAAGHTYPYGGSVRVSIFMAPAFCLLMGHAVACGVQALSSKRHSGAGFSLCILMFSFASLGVVEDVHQPYKTVGDVKAKEFSSWMATHWKQGEAILGWCNQKNGAPDFHGLGGSMARFRAQLRHYGIPVVWMDESKQVWLGTAPPMARSFWIMAYTDDNDTAMPFPTEKLERVLDSLQQDGRVWKHTTFFLQHAEKVDVYRFGDI